MGNSNSSAITINLDRTNAFYFSDECVSGIIDLNIKEGKLEANEIYIKLTGEIGYRAIREVSTGKGETTIETQDHHVPFYSTKIMFAQPESGQKELIYGQGQYFWPFQIPLTDYLPPTINKPLSSPHVRYYLQIVIDKPWYKPNTRQTRYLTIFPRVNLLQNPQFLLPTRFGNQNQNRHEIKLKGTLNKSGYVPNELIHVTLEIDNPRRVLIQRIDLSMLQSRRIGSDTSEYIIYETILPKILNLKDQQIKETFSIIVPSVPMPPSYQFQGGIYAIAIVNIHYILKFAVKIEGVFTNLNIYVPITLGTEPNPDLTQQQTFNPSIVSYSSNPEQSMFSDEDSPPTYDSVMQTIK